MRERVREGAEEVVVGIGSPEREGGEEKSFWGRKVLNFPQIIFRVLGLAEL